MGLLRQILSTSCRCPSPASIFASIQTISPGMSIAMSIRSASSPCGCSSVRTKALESSTLPGGFWPRGSRCARNDDRKAAPKPWVPRGFSHHARTSVLRVSFRPRPAAVQTLRKSPLVKAELCSAPTRASVTASREGSISGVLEGRGDCARPTAAGSCSASRAARRWSTIWRSRTGDSAPSFLTSDE